MASEVVIIGGGAIGLCCAHYLLADGHSVTVIERNGGRGGTSWGNAGMVVPSHFEPLANPGMLKLGLKMMLNPEGPLGFGGLNPELLGWMRRFMSHATHEHVEATSQLILDLNLQSRELYRDLIGDKLSLTGMLMVCKTENALGGERTLAKTANKLGLATEELDRFDLAKLGFDALGAIRFLDDAFLAPTTFLTNLRSNLLNQGVRIVEADVKEINSSSVKTNSGAIGGDKFVLAAGAWSHRLVANLPLIPGRGYGFTVLNPPRSTENCAILVEARVATTPMDDGQRFTGVMELGAYSSEPNPQKLDKIRTSIPEYLPAYENHIFDEPVWVGHRPCSPDGLPYIGSFAGKPNLLAATGHGMMGMSLAPITGKLVSQLINDSPTSINIAKCSPNRFL
ncbi:MAG: FAD-binding oxidoreductase [Fimbriimonadaceae bacterium]